MYRNYFLPASLLAGFIIGAGVFSLPYVFNSGGLINGFIFLGIATVLYVFIHLLYADLILRTPGSHEFVGYAKIYLGRFAELAAILIALVEVLAVLTIYLILSASFSDLLFPGAHLIKIIGFWLIASASVFMGVRRAAGFEFAVILGIVALMILIFGYGAPRFGGLEFSLAGDIKGLLLSFSPLLFALGGRVAITSTVRYFPESAERPKYVKAAVTTGTILPAVLYGMFVLGVIALSPVVTEDAVTGLQSSLPVGVMGLIGVLGLIALWSSYVPAGISIRNVMKFDLGLPSFIQAAIVVGMPLAIYLGGFRGFLALVKLVGGILLALEGIFIVLMWVRANRRTSPVLFREIHPISLVSCFLVLATAFGYEIMNLIS